MIGPAPALLAFSLTLNSLPVDPAALPLIDLPQPIRDSARRRVTSVEPSRPLTRAISRQPVPLASPPAQESAQAEWSRVQKLEPGREIYVTIRSTGQNGRIFVSADEAGITVLNLTDPLLPETAVRVLRETASQHPEHFVNAARGGTFLLDGVRMSATGIYFGDRKVADLEQLVQRHARTEVAQITVLNKRRGFWGRLGPLGGYFIGGMAGGYAGGVMCRAWGNRDCDTGPFLTGMMIGGVTGGVYGFKAVRREVENVIYDALENGF